MTRAAPKQRGAPVNGMLLLDKPAGLTSNRALQHVKRLLNARKGGHTGSLDPIATGLLPLCFGETTRIAGLFLSADKSYWVQIRFGVSTDSGDREGRVLREAKAAFSEAQLHAALEKFRGSFEQVPPMYSAVKRAGTPLYKLARRGIEVERAARAVTVHSLEVEKWGGDLLELRMSCSRGFYVRTLAGDLGDALGCGAHVRELRRLAVGDFSLDNAVTPQQLEALESPRERRALLLPTERGLAHLPEIKLAANAAQYLRRGRAVRAPPAEKGAASGLVRVYADGAGFLGLAEIGDDGKLTPRRLFQAG
ncbi:MAG: tRNA pseudouridine(55) synthase TruB [Gammaproteobacteria bacterium]